MNSSLTQNQIICLCIYELYSSEKDIRYLQYTGMLAIAYYLMKQGVFGDEYIDDILIYDYLDARRYLWEDKQFMQDINTLRDKKLLIRSRIRTLAYRDYNAHQISQKGSEYLKDSRFVEIAEQLRSLLSCPRCRRLYNIHLEKDAPRLICPHCRKKSCLVIHDFLKDGQKKTKLHLQPFYL